jgi:hypothetical protein
LIYAQWRTLPSPEIRITHKSELYALRSFDLAKEHHFARWKFKQTRNSPYCSSAAVTIFKGPVVIGKCGSIISKEIGKVLLSSDFPCKKKQSCDEKVCSALFIDHFSWKRKDANSLIDQQILVPSNASKISADRIVPVLFYWGHAFPHIIKDILPRIVLSLSYLEKFPDSKLLVDYSSALIGYLKFLGIAEDRVIFTKYHTPDTRSIYSDQLEFVYEASVEVAYPHCFPGPLWTGIYSSEIYARLRSLLRRNLPEIPYESRNLIVYVSRSGGSNSNSRTILNEAEILDHLQRVISTSSCSAELFVYLGSSTTLNSSLSIFSRARVVFGGHGGGFYNLIGSSVLTRVVELTPDDYGKHEVSRFSRKLGLEYRGFVKKGMSRTDSFGVVDAAWLVAHVMHAYDPMRFPDPPIDHFLSGLR